MSEVPDEEQCKALTNNREQCSRLVKEGHFCFQHDKNSETIEEFDGESKGVLDILSDQVEFKPERYTGIQRDVAQNLNDLLDDTRDIPRSFSSFNDALSAYRQTAGKTARTPAKYGLIGGAAGAPGGPFGTALGGTAGLWYGVYIVLNDDRAIGAVIVDEVPQDADLVSSDHEALADVQPIQMALKSAIETEENRSEWLRSTLSRERDMDSVEAALDEIPDYRTETGATVHYIHHEGSGEDIQLVFGEYSEDFESNGIEE